MARPTKADLEVENDELRHKLESIYDELGEFLDEGEEENSEEQDD